MSSVTLRRAASAFVVTGTLAAALTGTVAAATASPAAAAESAVTTTGPGTCPKGVNGALAFSTTLTNGSVRLGDKATVDGSTGKACGVLALNDAFKLIGTVKPANSSFAPVTTKVSLLSLPTTLKAASILKGPAGYTTAGLTTTLAGKVVATSEILGQKCDIPLDVKLTTGKSGALTGKAFATVKGVQRGKLVDNRFTVPKIQPSDTCNFLVASSSNLLLGLPLAAGASSITYDATLAFGSAG